MKMKKTINEFSIPPPTNKHEVVCSVQNIFFRERNVSMRIILNSVSLRSKLCMSLYCICLLLVANNASGHDGCINDEHVDHMGYTRTQNWLSTPQSTANGPDEDYIYGPTDFMTCTCVALPINYTRAKERIHQVSVGGSATVTAKSGLATKLIADAHASVTLNGGWEGTWKEPITVSVGPYNLPAWSHVTFEHVKTEKYTATGTVHSADCHFSCTRGLLANCDEFCNQVESTGNATGWTSAERVRFFNLITCPEKP